MSALFLIVGNSTSGKDTAINYALSRVKNLSKATRYITREASSTEDFISIKKEDFKPDDYSIYWESYGKNYGIKKKDLTDKLIKGENLIVNISRDVISFAKKLWKETYVVEFTVPVEIIEQRLLERKREDINEITQRILRAKQELNINPDIKIDSSSPDTSIAGEKLVQFIKSKISA